MHMMTTRCRARLLQDPLIGKRVLHVGGAISSTNSCGFPNMKKKEGPLALGLGLTGRFLYLQARGGEGQCFVLCLWSGCCVSNGSWSDAGSSNTYHSVASGRRQDGEPLAAPFYLPMNHLSLKRCATGCA